MKNSLFILCLFFSSLANAQAITEVIYPRFIQGVGSGNAADDRKVPYACRMTVTGLTANTTYRGYNKFVTDPTLTDNGQGNYIIVDPAGAGTFTRVTSASLATVGRYLEFTTNAAGNYTGWFIAEPNIATSHFQPGTQLYFRLMLNDGAGGAFVNTRVTASNPVTVLGFGATATTGTGIRGSASAISVAKNFIMLYDNTSATGRPVSGTFVESDGTDESIANGYAPFYANNVEGLNNTWGSIIPNNLANGINNISQYSLGTATLISACVSVNGVFGSTNTANASGGLTELVLNTSCTVLPVSLLNFAGTSVENRALLTWTTASEINLSKFIVESSKNGSDFSAVGSKTSTGNNSRYDFENFLPAGLTYYRLKMLDNDGKYGYSKIIALTNNEKETSLMISPNPARNELTITHSKASAGSMLRLYNANGQMLASKQVAVNEVQTSMDLKTFAPGMYILKYNNGKEVKTIPFQKL
ncbi:MAG: T9SS type A sorting domain-containing protein [Ferruginibacter sp.]